jgi:DNA-binding XRE family transcriptional regulator
MTWSEGNKAAMHRAKKPATPYRPRPTPKKPPKWADRHEAKLKKARAAEMNCQPGQSEEIWQEAPLPAHFDKKVGKNYMKRAVQTGVKEPQAVDRHVAGRICQKRIELDMSQQTLAQALGVTYQQLQKYEKGTNRVSAGRLFNLANAMAVEISYFFEGLPTGTPKRRKRV